ncbi:aminodeoxychorismate synthase component I [Candidatus Riesia pediculicola]|uniref:aminodeoxychorismate synthase n=1 Tax=Riesia pediculicola (strain USDA) TaxID=515618 RepID=D4G7R4_RIEPU|nr:aminodeoxychorismate synthase component I [Candidatus Riesia pediculicola]ADD79634.1 para-aminobenzoate synthase, component I [Candidatus Riesia pediculicola USDA]ARC53637.1 aminodeoxychorismate synthase component I [Candidatus Riesia pediculicola]
MIKYLKKKKLSYSKNIALHYFEKISHLPWSMILYSGYYHNLRDHFDILVSDPLITIETVGKITKITDEKKENFSESDPFEVLKKKIEILKTLYLCKSEENFPFQGGAVGIWSYELFRRIENFSLIRRKSLRLPDMAIGIYLWALIVDHKKRNAFLISYDNPEDRLDWMEKQENPKKKEDFFVIERWKSNLSKKQYCDKVERIKEYLISGDCYQINLSQRFHAKYFGDEWIAFLKSIRISQSPLSAFIRLKKNCVISLSPERFLRVDHNRMIETRPIKGTEVRSNNHFEDQKNIEKLKISEKNQSENVMIVDLLRNDLGKVSVPGTIQVKELFSIESFSLVHHLVSTIVGKLSNQYHVTDLLRSCFPGGSVTGAPKIRSMQIIDELEPNHRYGYCGSIGYISFCQKMDTNINIRSFLTEDQTMYCWSGSGIVLDSLSEKEYLETIHKFGKVLRYFRRDFVV